MFIDIDINLKPLHPQLFICKPNRQTIGKISTAYNINLLTSLVECNELDFSMPLKTDIHNQLKDNPEITKMKHRYLIKFVLGKYEEWFYITIPSEDFMENEVSKTFNCFALEHRLSEKFMRKYDVISYSPEEALTDGLEETNWGIGYINMELNRKKRAFEITSQNKYEFIKSMADTYDGIVLFNSLNKTINLYKEDEIGDNKGLHFKYGKYLNAMNKTLEIDNFCTRLRVAGKDNLSIERVNPLGLSYLEDFSYFMFPYQETITNEALNTYTVNSHSDYISDELCHAILKYNRLLDEKKGLFTQYLSEKQSLQIDYTLQGNKLENLETELTIILNELEIEIMYDMETGADHGNNIHKIIARRDAKSLEVKNKKADVLALYIEIADKDREIALLRNILHKTANFTKNQLEEMNDFIVEYEWADETLFDDEDLYIEAEKKIYEMNRPKDIIEIDIVNFLEIVECQRDWDKLSMGDIVHIEYEMFNLNATLQILEITYDFEGNGINLTIGDIQNIKSDEDKICDLLYKTKSATEALNIDKAFWKNMTNNFNDRNDRMTTPVANPIVKNDGTAIEHTLNGDGSANVSFEWEFEGKGDAYNIDGFLLYAKSTTDSNPYMFGSTIAKEQYYSIDYKKKAFVLYGVPANNYYSFGIQAYRAVDDDIHMEGVLRSEIVQSENFNENPYRPQYNVAFDGNITGTIDGTPVENIADKDHVDRVAKAEADLARIQAEANSDKKITKEEERAIQDAKGRLEEAKGYTRSKMGEFIEVTYGDDLSLIQEQLDGKIETWFQPSDPNNWLVADRTKHTGDIWYNDALKQLKRYDGATNKWADISDDAKALEAYQKAEQAQDTADGKRRIFLDTPYPPYDRGDLWKVGNSEDVDFKICVINRSSGSYNSAEWESATNAKDYADNTADIKAQEAKDHADAVAKAEAGLIEANITPSGATIVIADRDTSKNWEYANYIVPSGSVSAQNVINQAINSLPTGGKVILLDGTFKINGFITIKSYITIEGMGESTVIKASGSQLSMIVTQDLSNVGVKVNSILFDGSNRKIDSITLYKSVGAMITNCTFNNMTYSSEAKGGSICLIGTDSCIVQSCTFNNVYIGINVYGNNNTINGCIGISAGGSGIGFKITGERSAIPSSNNTVSNCNFSNGGMGGMLSFSAESNNIVNNTFSNNFASFRILGDGNQFTGNLFYNNNYEVLSSGGDVHASQIKMMSNNNTFQNNKVEKRQVNSGAYHGLHISGQDNVVTNNDFRKSGRTSGIYDTGSRTTTVSGNKV